MFRLHQFQLFYGKMFMTFFRFVFLTNFIFLFVFILFHIKNNSNKIIFVFNLFLPLTTFKISFSMKTLVIEIMVVTFLEQFLFVECLSSFVFFFWTFIPVLLQRVTFISIEFQRHWKFLRILLYQLVYECSFAHFSELFLV